MSRPLEDRLRISLKVAEKLSNKQPPVTKQEILQCFETRDGQFLQDTRENNATNPPTLWFIAETYYGRKLKVVFISKGTGEIVIKTAFDPNADELWIYDEYGRQ